MAYWGPPPKVEEEEEEPLFFLPNLDELTNDPVPFTPSIPSSSANNNNIWGAPIVLQTTKNELAAQKKKVAIEWTRIVQELRISAHLPAILEALEACNALGVPIQELDIVEFSFALAETDCPESVRRALIRKLNNVQLPQDESALNGGQSNSMAEVFHPENEHIQDDHQGEHIHSTTKNENEMIINPESEQVSIEIDQKARQELVGDRSSPDVEHHDLESNILKRNSDEDDAADKNVIKQGDSSRLQARTSEGSNESAGSGSTDATSASPDFGANPSLTVDNYVMKEDDLSLPKYSIDSTDSIVQSEEQTEPPKPRSESLESQQHTHSDSDTVSLEEEKKVIQRSSFPASDSNVLEVKSRTLKKTTSNEKRHDKWDKGKKKRKKRQSIGHIAEEVPSTESNIEPETHKSIPIESVVDYEEEDAKVSIVSHVYHRKSEQMIKLLHRVKAIVVEMHQLALSSDREVKWIFGFIFCFPEIVEWTIGHYAPSWASVCLFYAFLIQILCVDSASGGRGGSKREWKTSILRRVIPLAFLLDGVSHPSLLLGFDRYELLITATLISAIKIVHSLNPIVVLGMGFQVLFPLMARDMVCQSTMCHSLMLYVQALMGLCCLVVAKGER